MPKNRYPNLGRLGIAILESRVKSLIGESAIQILRKPVEEKDLQERLASALSRTEARFRIEFTDKKLSSALIDLPLANLPSIQEAVQSFYLNPSSPLLANVIKAQLKADYPNFKKSLIEKASDAYLNILHEELISISEGVREKITSLAILGIERSLEQITKGDMLFEKLQKSPKLSRNIRTRTFKTLVDERTRNFIGRDYVFKAINELIGSKNFPSGYILIHGEPGIGKTSLIAQLIKLHGYVHHFNIAAQNICSISDFLSNFCSQLIISFKLNYDHLPENALHDSGFLAELLSAVAVIRSGRETVLLIDAIDEASDIGLAPNSNRLYLPIELPKGIYFIATTREQINYRLLVDNRQDFYIKDDDPANLDDIHKYIERFLLEYQEDMDERIAKWQITKLDFIQLLGEKSQGNFMYLVHVMRDIRDKRILATSLDNIQNLPTGLRQYYQRHWHMLQEEDKIYFENFEKTVICILASIRESVSVGQLMEWTRQSELDIRRTINKWREFLNVDNNEKGELVYRIYHSSFQDFLREDVGLKQYHELIAKSALKKIRR